MTKEKLAVAIQFTLTGNQAEDYLCRLERFEQYTESAGLNPTEIGEERNQFNRRIFWDGLRVADLRDIELIEQAKLQIAVNNLYLKEFVDQ